MSTKTITAIGTALLNSGISIIRISGEDSLPIINKIFRTKNILEPNKIVYGKIVDDSNIIDSVLVSYFKAPNSFTGEDICEINCHGGVEITKQILELVLDKGAILASPGEFSKRAFLNGKMDLSQAESIIDLINSKTKTEAQVAIKLSRGDLFLKIKDLRQELIELLAHIEVSVDYPEYDYEEVENTLVVDIINRKIFELNKLLDTYNQGKYIKDGVKVAILGRPNVGKSSLLNNFAKQDRAIVTNIAGTTRDIIEEVVSIGDLILNISDTAGIRNTEDCIEKIGVGKSIKMLDEVDLVIYMISATENINNEDIDMLSKIQNKGLKLVTTINKIDEGEKTIYDHIVSQLKTIGIKSTIDISVLNDTGIENLKNEIISMFLKSDYDFERELIITNKRHQSLLKKSISLLEEAKKEIEDNVPIDIISIIIKDSTKNLGEIIGVEISEEVMSKIFEKFCLGK